MQKLTIESARVNIRASWTSQGSVLRGTIEAIPNGFDIVVSVQSKDPLDRILLLLRNSERSCFVQQTIEKPVRVTSSYSINGREVELR
jgi:hypothetical protein